MAYTTSPADSTTTPDGGNDITLKGPSLSLPKGGGAIQGIGEKFGVDAVTGTGSMSVPIAVSPGRSGFGPQLALHYASGSGNGPFGLGWSLQQPSIARKTDKGLPLYRDSEESDVFILSGAEDLVPLPPGPDNDPTYSIRRYRPRVDALFARIERFTNRATGEIHWRSISRDNITTLYGSSAASRIASAVDPLRIFQWMIDQSFDDKGNAIVYEYAPEDSVNLDLTPLHERNRTPLQRGVARYLKRIRYGNRTPNRDLKTWTVLDATTFADNDWMFEIVFDYGDGLLSVAPADGEGRVFATASDEAMPGSIGWMPRQDPFSTYRAGFEHRQYRLCSGILMFHRFPNELGIDVCLVRSTTLTFSPNPVATYLTAVTQSGFVRQPTDSTPNRYLMRSMPPLSFDYSTVPSADKLAARPVREVPFNVADGLPLGVDGRLYQWLDLNGEGMPGIFSEQANDWYFKANRSANHKIDDGAGGQVVAARFGPLKATGIKPAASARGDMYLDDLNGDGLLDLVRLDGAARGYHERDEDGQWGEFQAFEHCPAISLDDPNLRRIDLNGDGYPDILVTVGNRLRWYPSLAELGFGDYVEIELPGDEERGPRLVFNDGEFSLYLADMSGTGIALVRVRNGNVAYWPSLGYGRFGAKVAMDNAPWFDSPDRYDQRRLRLADIDGSGTSDLIYLHPDGPRLFANQSGNGFAPAVMLAQFPNVSEPDSVQVLDLLGTGTASLVWNSPLPGAAGRSIRYLTLMDSKPHLLIGVRNNLGAETRVVYAPSTQFYLDDLEAGVPWLTRLAFPVHVVERVQHIDRIAGNVFTSRNAYHSGLFDPIEREFRGFSMVEQWADEAIGVLSGTAPLATRNIDPASNVPSTLTRSWFHTGLYMDLDRLLERLAGLRGSSNAQTYFRPPGLSDADFQALLLPATTLPSGPTPDDVREACRALKGTLLRQEIYAVDGSPNAGIPYTVAEHNATVTLVQPIGSNRHAICRVDAAESVTFNYERQVNDPRVAHTLTLQVDEFGDVLQSASIAYGRRQPDPALALDDQATQAKSLLTYTISAFSNAIDQDESHRTPVTASTVAYELSGYAPSGPAGRFQASDLFSGGAMVFDTEIAYEDAATGGRQRRPIDNVRTLYRGDDLSAVLPLGTIESMALPWQTFRQSLTPGLITRVLVRSGAALLPTPADVLDKPGGSTGGYVDLDGDGHHWIPSGSSFFSPGSADDAPAELAHGRAHFFQTCRYRTPFHAAAASTESFISWDPYDLLMLETRDALGNRTTAGQRKADESLDMTEAGNDYRVLRPCLVSDPNRNRQAIAFDALGFVTATAVMGTPDENLGDTLTGFDYDPTDAVIQAQIANPTLAPLALLGNATTRFIYDLAGYQQSALPPAALLIARDLHVLPPNPAQPTLQIGLTYSDGFGREIQTKRLAPPGKVPQRDQNGAIVIGADGQPVLSAGSVDPRYRCSGWSIFNNQGKSVRRYESFFTDTPAFELGVVVGVSPVLFYDPLQRVIATLHPDDSYDKVLFSAWSTITWDANDTVLLDPRTDPDITALTAGYFAGLPGSPTPPFKTWYQQRQETSADPRDQDAAKKAANHAGTPSAMYADSLGRPFLTVADNGPDPANPGQHLLFKTRTNIDIEGNKRGVVDALGRLVMSWDYDMLGRQLRQQSLESGARWVLNDATGKSLRTWDSRAHTTRIDYDPLRRPIRIFVTGADSQQPANELLTERLIYGEQCPTGADLNLKGQLWRRYDQAGLATVESMDFKGNTTQSSRCVASDYKNVIPWSSVDASIPVDATATVNLAALDQAGAPSMDTNAYVSATLYDALDRPMLLTSPHTPTMSPNQTQQGYDLLGQITTVQVNLRGAKSGNALAWTPFVTGIDYDAKGQRQSISYGNGTTTWYGYERETFRLESLLTVRNAVKFPGDAPNPPPVGWPGSQIQNLAYTYDPIGNVTRITDTAQQTIFFSNLRVEPSNDYTYDALYRLSIATGRESLGQKGGSPIPHSWNDAPRVGISWQSNDGNAMGTYSESYVYDAVGNLLTMGHAGLNPANPGWVRGFAYQEWSQLEPLKVSNRLSATTLDRGTTWERYSNSGDGYDAHGNMLHMPHLPTMAWDYRDCLRSVDLLGGGDAWYVYDSAGLRVRKVWEKAEGRTEERIYLAGFEIFRCHPGAIGVGTATLERETMHVMDDTQRISLIETRTINTKGTDKAAEQLIRYQFGNHLSSAVVELNEQSQIISYEEYAPYCSTTYQAVSASIKAAAKRYRYAGKERDEITGFCEFGKRRYSSWLGRWISTDPAFLADGPNAYLYTQANPIRFIDPSGTETEPTRWEWFKSALRNSGIVRDFAVIPSEVRTIVNDIRGGGYKSVSAADVWRQVDVRKTQADNVRESARIFQQQGLSAQEAAQKAKQFIGGFAFAGYFLGAVSAGPLLRGLGTTKGVANWGRRNAPRFSPTGPPASDTAAPTAPPASEPNIPAAPSEPGTLPSGNAAPPAPDNAQIYMHQINRGGLAAIVRTGQLISTPARSAAGGSEGVRATAVSKIPDPWIPTTPGVGEKPTIFFTTPSVPRPLHAPEIAPGVNVEWSLPENELLDINILEVHLPGY